jgi:hypothetical protein
LKDRYQMDYAYDCRERRFTLHLPGPYLASYLSDAMPAFLLANNQGFSFAI